MLKKKQPKEHNPVLKSGVDAVRKMLMDRGYFIRNVISVSESEIDIVAIREGLLHSEKMLIRIVQPDQKGGLGTNTIKRFFSSQEKVFNLKCVLVSLSFVSRQVLRYIRRHEYTVFDLKWLKSNTDFPLRNEQNEA